MSEDEFEAWLRAAHEAALQDLAAHINVRGALRALKRRAARRPRIRRWRLGWRC